MKKILYTITIILFGIGIASANGFFPDEVQKILDKWHQGPEIRNAGIAERYSEPENMKIAKVKIFNTYFSNDVLETLDNWGKDTRLKNIGIAEGYSEPKEKKQHKIKMFNKYLSDDVLEMLDK